jgi:heptosyltransferase-1
VDQAFSGIPSWHPAVSNVIASPPRKLSNLRRTEFQSFVRDLRATTYDRIVDLQGHWKSAVVARLAHGVTSGYTGSAVNEWGAHLFYSNRLFVPKQLHSIERMRRLMASAIGYSFDAETTDYGIDRSRFPKIPLTLPNPYMVFIHSTSWESKNWPEQNWQELRAIVIGAGFYVLLPWGNSAERNRAERIAAGEPRAIVLPELSISQKAAVLAEASATIGLDTGLSHIAAALGVPSVTLYGATDPLLSGAIGQNQIHLTSEFQCLRCHRSRCDYPDEHRPACFKDITPARVWDTLNGVISFR